MFEGTPLELAEYLNVPNALKKIGTRGIRGIVNQFTEKGKGNPPNIKYPGKDPTKKPGPDWEWRGQGDPASGKGSWYNPKTKESLHPDLNHPQPIGSHWDYKSPDGTNSRIFPDGRIEVK